MKTMTTRFDNDGQGVFFWLGDGELSGPLSPEEFEELQETARVAARDSERTRTSRPPCTCGEHPGEECKDG